MRSSISGPQIVLLAVALLILAVGAYMVFVEGEVLGVVLMGLATTLSALTAVIGAPAEKNKDIGDAG